MNHVDTHSEVITSDVTRNADRTTVRPCTAACNFDRNWKCSQRRLQIIEEGHEVLRHVTFCEEDCVPPAYRPMTTSFYRCASGSWRTPQYPIRSLRCFSAKALGQLWWRRTLDIVYRSLHCDDLVHGGRDIYFFVHLFIYGIIVHMVQEYLRTNVQ